MKRQIALSIFVIILYLLVFSPLVLAEEEVTVPQDQIKPEYFSQLTATQLTKEKVTVPKSWVKESYFEEAEGQDSEKPDFTATNWRWGLEKINAPAAWKITKGEGVVIAVIDGGVNFEHPALVSRAWVNEDEIPGNGIDDDGNGYVDDIHGWDFIDNDSGAEVGSDFHGHGTSMGDVACGNLTSAGRGGVAPKAKVMDLRVVDVEDDLGSWNDFVDAFRYAWQNGADIVSFSIAFDYGDRDYQFTRVVRMVARDVIIIGGVGNDSSRVQPPATMEEIVAVTATGRYDRLYYNANQGPEVAFAAPGKDIMQAEKRGYDTASGTSLAAPHVAGTTALILSVNPDLTPEEVFDILAETARDLGPEGRDEKFGYGLIDAEAAVEETKARRED